MGDSPFKYFVWDDFKCSHCGQNETQEALIRDLDELRSRCGFPLAVASGYRCPDHNDAVSTTGRHGPHTTGLAVDLRVDRERAFLVVEHAVAMNLERMRDGLGRAWDGLGVHQKGTGRFIHLDKVPAHFAPRPTIWSY